MINQGPNSIPAAMDRPNRTFISSVLFLDIVGYTKQPVTEQIRSKEQFNTLVSHLISDIPETDRIVLDTGDGAALSFLGDPEDALFVAVKLRDAIKEKQEHEFPDLHLRMGINLGPVKLLKDINGRPNLIGDGINVAQRVMNFAEPDQILVSRSFYDVVSCLSDEYRNLFSHQGTQTDKHVREHELYEIGFVDPDRSMSISQRMQVLDARTRIPPDQMAFLETTLRRHVGDHAHVLVQAKAMGAPDFAALRGALADYITDPTARDAFSRTEPPQPGQPGKSRGLALPLGLGACVVAVIAAGLWMAWPKPPAAESAPLAQAPAQEEVKPPSPPGDAAPPAVPPADTAAAATPPPTTPAVPAAPKPANPIPASKASAPKVAQDKKGREAPKDAKSAGAAHGNAANAAGSLPRDVADAPRSPPPANATLRIQVAGNAEIYVDGMRIGSSGSVLQYLVTPGQHTIQVRECGFPPSTKSQSVSIKANDVKLIVLAC